MVTLRIVMFRENSKCTAAVVTHVALWSAQLPAKHVA